jgi:hypothetical protein
MIGSTCNHNKPGKDLQMSSIIAHAEYVTISAEARAKAPGAWQVVYTNEYGQPHSRESLPSRMGLQAVVEHAAHEAWALDMHALVERY